MRRNPPGASPRARAGSPARSPPERQENAGQSIRRRRRSPRRGSRGAPAAAIRAQAPQRESSCSPARISAVAALLAASCDELGRHLGRQPATRSSAMAFFILARLPSPFVAAAPRCPAFCTVAFIRPIRGRRSAGRRFFHLVALAKRDAHLLIGARARRRSTLAFFRCGSALPSSAFPPVIVQRAPRGRVVVPGGRVPHLPSLRLRAAAAGRQPRSTFGSPPENGPHERGLTGCLASCSYVVNTKFLNVDIKTRATDARIAQSTSPRWSRGLARVFWCGRVRGESRRSAGCRRRSRPRESRSRPSRWRSPCCGSARSTMTTPTRRWAPPPPPTVPAQARPTDGGASLTRGRRPCQPDAGGKLMCCL